MSMIHHYGFDVGSEARCEICGTVMHTVDGCYWCSGCRWELAIPWAERPAGGDGLPVFVGF